MLLAKVTEYEVVHSANMIKYKRAIDTMEYDLCNILVTQVNPVKYINDRDSYLTDYGK